MLHKSGIVPELMDGDRFQLEIKNYPYPPLFLARDGETLSLSQHTGQGVERTLEQKVEFTIEATGKLTLLEEEVFSININKDAQEMCADWSNQGYADGIKKTWEAEQQIEQFSLLDAAEQPVVEDSVEFEPAEVAIQAALDPEARNAVLGEVIEEEVPPTQVPLVINALTAEDQTVSEQAQLEPSTVAIAPIAVRTERERYSPTLEEMRNWRLDATLLGRNANYEKRIKQLGNEMLQGEQSQLPREQRDPAFQNPDFTLSEKAYQAMQSDSSESQQMRTPTRGDLIVWFQAAQLSNQDEVVTDHIKNLGRQMIQGTDQERLAPKDRDTHFKNPDFVLSRQDFVAMKAAIAPYQNSVEEGRENLRRPQLSI